MFSTFRSGTTYALLPGFCAGLAVLSCYVIIGFSIARVLSTTTNATHILIPITHQALMLIAPFLIHVWCQLPSLV
jgi:hypothetical protein